MFSVYSQPQLVFHHIVKDILIHHITETCNVKYAVLSDEPPYTLQCRRLGTVFFIFDLALFARADGTGGLTLHYDAASRVCTVDRRAMAKRFNQAVFEVLDVPLETPLRKLRVFIDRSSTEFFFNDGEAAFTTHSYPEADEHRFNHSPAEVKLWTLETSVRDDFVV